MVILSFRVDTAGRAGGALSTNWETKEDDDIDKELRNAVKEMPLWEPSRLLKRKSPVAEYQFFTFFLFSPKSS